MSSGLYTSLTDYAERSVRSEMIDLTYQVIALGHFLMAFGMLDKIQLDRVMNMLLSEEKKDLAGHLNSVNYIMGQFNDKLVSFAKQAMSEKDMAVALAHKSSAVEK